jgi:hypothetical protein
MNGGIIRNALTTTLALELEYREPSILREFESDYEPPAEHPCLEPFFEKTACFLDLV